MFLAKYFFFLLMLLPFAMKGQDAFLENFINDVADQVVPKDLRYFYFLDTSFTIKGEGYGPKDMKDLPRNYRNIPLELFNMTDSTQIKWDAYTISRGRPLSRKASNNIRHYWGISRHIMPYDTPQKTLDSLNRLKGDEVYVAIKENWSKKKIERKMKKTIYEKREEHKFFYFSTPVFSADKKYAVIGVNEIGHGDKYLFKYNGKKWIKLTSFHWWIS